MTEPVLHGMPVPDADLCDVKAIACALLAVHGDRPDGIESEAVETAKEFLLHWKQRRALIGIMRPAAKAG